MTVLVTGGAGFIGSHLVDSLVKRGHHVRVVDNLQAGKRGNLAHHRPRDVEFLRGDLRLPGTARRAVRGVSQVFHIGANASVPDSVEDPRYDFETNGLGTLYLLDAARREEVERFTYASTAAVYGEPDYTPMDEAHPLHPISPYGASKLAGERAGFAFHEAYGLRFAAVRIFNTYGPRQPRYVMYDLIRKLQRDPRHLEVLGTGRQVRDYCYATDMAEALLRVSRRGQGVYNAAGGHPTTIRQVAEAIVRRVSPGAKITYTGKSWPGDVQTLVANIQALRGLGWRPRVGLDEGLNRLVRWMDEHR